MVRGCQLAGAEVYAPRAGCFRGARLRRSRRVGQMNTRGTCSAPSLRGSNGCQVCDRKEQSEILLRVLCSTALSSSTLASLPDAFVFAGSRTRAFFFDQAGTLG